MAQTSGDVSVSAQVSQSGPETLSQGAAAVLPFFIENITIGTIEKLKTASLIFSGKTSPGAAITIEFIQAGVSFNGFADSNGNFHIERKTLFNNYYDILVKSTDVFKRTSKVVFLMNITPGANQKEDILLPPTLFADKTEVPQGQPIKIEGSSYPLSSVIINLNELGSSSILQFVAQSNELGRWSFIIPSNQLKLTTYLTSVFLKTKDNLVSSPGEMIVLRIVKSKERSNEAVSRPQVPKMALPTTTASQDGAAYQIKNTDLTEDNKVGLKDLSILLANFAKRDFNPKTDLNNDKKVDFKDLSIMMFYWTR